MGPFWYLLERVERCDQRGAKAQITLTVSSIEWLLLVISGALVYLFISSNWIGLSSRIGVMQFFGGLFFAVHRCQAQKIIHRQPLEFRLCKNPRLVRERRDFFDALY